MDFLTIVLLISLASFIATYIIIPEYIKRAKTVGIVGVDKYKKEKKEIAESGGITVLFGYLTALFLSLYFFQEYTVQIFAVATTVLLVAFIGMIDDFYKISWRTKTLLPLLAAPPLMAIKAGVTAMYIPFVGIVDFGIIYTLVLIPLAITGAANAVNMVAGYNGLEAGLGIITISALSVIGYLTGNTIVLLLSLPLLFTLIAFYQYNRYPARIFPGDSGTFLIGVMLAVI
ncbi:MAG: glycosyl transferase family 4, partial [archaeon]|nr:glycosyl transferase family 4 [archaeon]